MEGSFCKQQARAPGAAASELDGRFHPFATGACEMGFPQAPTRALAKSRSKLARQARHVALKHHRTRAIQLFLQRSDNTRMVVTSIVYAVSGKEIEHSAPVRPDEFNSFAARK